VCAYVHASIVPWACAAQIQDAGCTVTGCSSCGLSENKTETANGRCWGVAGVPCHVPPYFPPAHVRGLAKALEHSVYITGIINSGNSVRSAQPKGLHPCKQVHTCPSVHLLPVVAAHEHTLICDTICVRSSEGHRIRTHRTYKLVKAVMVLHSLGSVPLRLLWYMYLQVRMPATL
jgi:hypothetical protein